MLQSTYVKSKLINILIVIKFSNVFVGSDVQKLPLPHGGHQLLRSLCNSCCRAVLENLYILCWKSKKLQVYNSVKSKNEARYRALVIYSFMEFVYTYFYCYGCSCKTLKTLSSGSQTDRIKTKGPFIVVIHKFESSTWAYVHVAIKIF